MSINRGRDKEDVVHTYNGILLSHKKEWNNAINSNKDGLETVKVSEVSQKEKDKYIISLMWNLQKWYRWTCLQKRNRITDIEKKLMIDKESELGDWD